MSLRWMHKVRLYPTTVQVARLNHALHLTRNLYNAALEQRTYEYRVHGRSVSENMQSKQLTDLRSDGLSDTTIHREWQDTTLHRLDLAMTAFFRRVKRGETPGYPRFKSDARWNNLAFQHGRGLKLDPSQTKVRVPGVGFVRLRKGRDVPLNYGRAFIVRKNSKWYAVFECKREPDPLPSTGRVVGIDAGINHLFATSDGHLIDNPRHTDSNAALVARASRSLDAVTVKDAAGRVLNRKDPKRQSKAMALARAKEREANRRLDSLHKLSTAIIASYDKIALEKLDLRAMTRASNRGLNRSMRDAGFGMFRKMIAEKAEYAARTIAIIQPEYTSQTCFECKHVDAKNRNDVRFACLSCGHSDHADINAAKNILAKAEWLPRSGLSPGNARFLQKHSATRVRTTKNKRQLTAPSR